MLANVNISKYLFKWALQPRNVSNKRATSNCFKANEWERTATLLRCIQCFYPIHLDHPVGLLINILKAIPYTILISFAKLNKVDSMEGKGI